MADPITAFLADVDRAVGELLERVLPPADSFPHPLGEAIRYSILDRGTRLRPALCLAAAKCLGAEDHRALPVAAALEMIHACSTIHDDLPALSGVSSRRGKPACHAVYGEAVAILAGDALMTRSFQLIGEAEHIAAGDLLRIVVEVSSAGGQAGLVGGEAADLGIGGGDVDLPTLEYIHTHKTGALVQAAVRCGGIAAGARETGLRALSSYGRRLGLGFQIIDDILNVKGKPGDGGRAAGGDRRFKKATYPAVFGIEPSRQRACELIEEAVKALENFEEEADLLRGLARFVERRSQ